MNQVATQWLNNTPANLLKLGRIDLNPPRNIVDWVRKIGPCKPEAVARMMVLNTRTASGKLGKEYELGNLKRSRAKKGESFTYWVD